MPPLFTAALAKSLSNISSIRVVEGAEGMTLKAGTVYIAPGGKQMRVEKAGSSVQLRLSDDPPENGCRPAADFLFRSVATVYKSTAVGVIMTGMGCDGTKGLREMKLFGAKVIAQDQESSTVFGMPKEAIKAGVVDVIAPLDLIADEIVAAVG